MKHAAPVPAQNLNDQAATRASPMMAQYLEIKAANPDCLLFYRMGDFYELFFEDAEIAARALGIVLTKRGKHQGEDIPMCGVPVERADDYLQRPDRAGPPRRRLRADRGPGRGAQARREIRGAARRRAARHARHDHRGAAARSRARQHIPGARPGARSRRGAGRYGLAAVDISTGAFTVTEASEERIAGEIARIEPAEIVAARRAAATTGSSRRVLDESRAPIRRSARDAGEARRRAAPHGFLRRRDARRIWRALARRDRRGAPAIVYVERTQIGARPP